MLRIFNTTLIQLFYTRMSELNYLIYVSSGCESINYQLPFLLNHSEDNNKVYGITGVLLFDDGNIMQYLEGPQISVNQLYERIEHDSRHRNITKIIQESIEVRMFPEWHMGFKSFNDPSIKHMEKNSLKLKNTIYSTPSKTNPRAALLLRGFWQRCSRHQFLEIKHNINHQ